MNSDTQKAIDAWLSENGPLLESAPDLFVKQFNEITAAYGIASVIRTICATHSAKFFLVMGKNAGNHDLWSLLSELKDLLPTLDLDPSVLVQFFRDIFPKIRSDLLSYILDEALCRFADSHPDLVEPIADLCMQDPDEGTTYYLVSILTGSMRCRMDLVLAYTTRCLSSIEPLLRIAGVSTVRAVIQRGVSVLDELIPTVAELAVSETDDSVQANLVRFFGTLYESSGTGLAELTALVEKTKKPSILFSLSTAMLTSSRLKAGDAQFGSFLRTLIVGTPPSLLGVLNRIDVLLAKTRTYVMITASIIMWLEQQLLKIETKVQLDKLFPQSLAELAKHPIEFAKLTTILFNSDHIQLHQIAAQVVWYYQLHVGKTLKLDGDLLASYSETDCAFISEKIAGHVTDARQLCSLVLSCARETPGSEKLTNKVVHMFRDYVMPNYTSQTRRLLESVEKDDLLPLGHPQKKVARLILKELDAYERRLASGRPLKELEPPSRLIHSFAQARHEANNRQMKSVSEKSAFLSSVTKVPIKWGKGSFSFHEGHMTPKTDMKEFSFEMDVPRRLLVDIVGLEIQLATYRVSRRNENIWS